MAALCSLGDLISPSWFHITARLVSSFLSRGISQESCVESSTLRKGLTWESPWEWWMGGALGWSGRGGCGRTPLWPGLATLLRGSQNFDAYASKFLESFYYNSSGLYRTQLELNQ